MDLGRRSLESGVETVRTHTQKRERDVSAIGESCSNQQRTNYLAVRQHSDVAALLPERVWQQQRGSWVAIDTH